MTDIHSKEVRSYNMSRVRSKDTKPELVIRKFLHSQGFRYRLHVKDLPGKPDLVLTKYKTVIFVNGCFWHGHEGCKYSTLPKTRTDWWKNKIELNISKDIKVRCELEKANWKVVTIWGCDLKNNKSELLTTLLANLSDSYEDLKM